MNEVMSELLILVFVMSPLWLAQIGLAGSIYFIAKRRDMPRDHEDRDTIVLLDIAGALLAVACSALMISMGSAGFKLAC